MKKYLPIICLLGFLSGRSQQNLMNGLQACYPLDCVSPAVNAAVTGAVLNGTVMGNVTCTVGHQGFAGTAMKFGGTASDFIALPSNTMIKPTTSLTVSGWYYVNTTAHQDLIFTKNLCTSFFNGYNLIAEAGFFRIQKLPGITGNCGPGVVATSATFAINAWHHVVFYLDNLVAKIVVDNNAPVVVNHTHQFEYHPAGEVILGGTNETASNFPYTGSIDHLRFYNRELRPGQIDTLYNMSVACTGTITGIADKDAQEQELSFYPNPSEGKFNFQGEEGIAVISSVSGQMILRQNMLDNNLIDLSNETPGIYFLTLLRGPDQPARHARLIVVR